MINFFREFVGIPASSDEEEEKSSENHLQVDFFSLNTFYYIVSNQWNFLFQ